MHQRRGLSERGGNLDSDLQSRPSIGSTPRLILKQSLLRAAARRPSSLTDSRGRASSPVASGQGF